MSKPKVLLVGWDAADWKLIKPLLDRGEIPAIASLIEGGVMGNLATLQPVLSPMLWNSIGTGMRPSKHGILGFTEVNPHTQAVGPSLSTSRKVKALWNILSQEGLRTHVVNWFASHPAEPINGVCISDFFAKIPRDLTTPWRLQPGVVHPKSAAETYAGLRMHPNEVDGDLLQLFCPRAHEVDQDKDRRLLVLARLIAEAFSVHSAVTHVLAHEEWDFVGVYYGSIDHFSHAFMAYHPPRMETIPEPDYELYKDVVTSAYRLHDRMLAGLLNLVDDDTTVIVCSDHGFHSDHLRPAFTPAIPAGPAIWHRDQGILLMRGPNIVADELIHGASLLDITPTVLQLLGLPIGRDMDGRPLLEAMRTVDGVSSIDSWETHEGAHPPGAHPEAARMTAEESAAIMDQFVALGYIERPEGDAADVAARTARELNWNLARSHIDAGEITLAQPLIEALVDEAPERRDVVLTYVSCLRAFGLHDEAEATVRTLVPGEPDHPGLLHQLAENALGRGDAESALELLQRLEARAGEEPTRTIGPDRHLTLGATYQKLRRWEQALACYERVITIDPDHPRAHLGAAQCLLRLHRGHQAVAAALTAVELQYDLGLAHHTLGIALARTEQYTRASEAFLTALRFIPGYLASHRYLARVYRKIEGKQELAATHANHAAEMRAATANAEDRFAAEREALRARAQARIERLGPFYVELIEKEAREADEKQARIEAGTATETMTMAARPPAPSPENARSIVIVSGLPRSGTSLAMQMLQAGGMEVMTDGERTADEDNPAGYLEWEAVKTLQSNPQIIEQADGKAVKVISMLIPHLPLGHDYKVIFMMRPIEEIVASQQKMIERRQAEGAQLDTEDLARNLADHRKAILQMIGKRQIPCFRLGYRRMLEDPAGEAARIAKFLGGDRAWDQAAMAATVRPELYRNRGAVKVGADADPEGETPPPAAP